jgi:hypothetical protein
MQSFSVIKDELYALGLDAYVQRRGELLLVTLEINTIADSFAFDGDRILFEATKLLGGAIFRPCLKDGVFPEENIESEKKCLIEEIASAIENKPSYAMRRAKQILCEGEPFAVDVGGEIDRVGELDGKELSIAMNGKFLMDAMKALEEEKMGRGDPRPDVKRELFSSFCLQLLNEIFLNERRGIPIRIPRGVIKILGLPSFNIKSGSYAICISVTTFRSVHIMLCIITRFYFQCKI